MSARRAAPAWGALLLALLGSAPAARAHWLRPEQVMAQLRADAAREPYGVVEVARSERLPRLLVIRVDGRWARAEPGERQRASERWRRLWRESVPRGSIAVVDAESGTALVHFDAEGRAQLREAGGKAAAESTVPRPEP